MHSPVPAGETTELNVSVAYLGWQEQLDGKMSLGAFLCGRRTGHWAGADTGLNPGTPMVEGVFNSKSGGFHIGSFSGLTSKIPPLGSILNFDADVKTATARNRFRRGLCPSP